eukprot:752783-Hanusia_phi.AAC.2
MDGVGWGDQVVASSARGGDSAMPLKGGGEGMFPWKRKGYLHVGSRTKWQAGVGTREEGVRLQSSRTGVE